MLVFGVGDVEVGAHYGEVVVVERVYDLGFAHSFIIIEFPTAIILTFLPVVLLDSFIGTIGIILIIFRVVELEDSRLFFIEQIRWSINNIVPNTEPILRRTHIIHQHSYCYDIVSGGDRCLQVDNQQQATDDMCLVTVELYDPVGFEFLPLRRDYWLEELLPIHEFAVASITLLPFYHHYGCGWRLGLHLEVAAFPNGG